MHLVGARGHRALDAAAVQRERGVDDAVDAMEGAEHLLGAGHLRHDLRVHEAAALDAGQAGRREPVAQLGAHGRLERDLVVLQPVAGTDIAERDVHQAAARFAATDWKNSITTFADNSGCSMRFVWPLPSIT